MKDREEYISILEQDNAELKKQLEEYKYSHSCSFIDTCKNVKIANYEQQQEFIKYLEDYINSLKKEYGNYVNDDYSEEYGRYYTAKEILQKYKEIIGEK